MGRGVVDVASAVLRVSPGVSDDAPPTAGPSRAASWLFAGRPSGFCEMDEGAVVVVAAALGPEDDAVPGLTSAEAPSLVPEVVVVDVGCPVEVPVDCFVASSVVFVLSPGAPGPLVVVSVPAPCIVFVSSVESVASSQASASTPSSCLSFLLVSLLLLGSCEAFVSAFRPFVFGVSSFEGGEGSFAVSGGGGWLFAVATGGCGHGCGIFGVFGLLGFFAVFGVFPGGGRFFVSRGAKEVPCE